MVNFLIIAIVVLIVGFAARYIHLEKKRGVKCIGCPNGCSCASGQNGDSCCCGCSSCGPAKSN